MGLKIRYSRASTRVLNRLSTSKGADVASATNITLGSDGNVFDITGTTTIAHINPTNWNAGDRLTLQFDGALVLTDNAGTDTSVAASILLLGSGNLTTIAGMVIRLYFDGTNFIQEGPVSLDTAASTGTTTGFTAGSGTATKDDSTFTGNLGSTAYTIGDLVKRLKQLGLLAR